MLLHRVGHHGSAGARDSLMRGKSADALLQSGGRPIVGSTLAAI
jgi:hypothetical protein